jgi:hypothetical protein
MSRNLEVAVAGSRSRDGAPGSGRSASLVPDGRVLAASASVTPLVTASWPRDPAAQRQQIPAEPTGSGFGGSHDGCLGRAAFHVRG